MEVVTLKRFEELTGWKPATIRKMLHEDVHYIKPFSLPGVEKVEKLGRDWFLTINKKKLKKV